MAATALKLTDLQVANGEATFTFGKRSVVIALDAQRLQAMRDELLSFDRMAMEVIALCIARQPALGNKSALIGKSLTKDFAISNASNWA